MTNSVKKLFNNIAGSIVNYGCSNCFINIAKATMPAGTNLIIKGVTILGAALMGSMFGDKTYEYTSEQVKNFTENVKTELAKENDEEEE